MTNDRPACSLEAPATNRATEQRYERTPFALDRPHAPSSLQNICLSSDVANRLSWSHNWRADGDGVRRFASWWESRGRSGLNGCRLKADTGEHRLQRCKGVGARIAAAACAPDVARPCHRFTRPGEC